MQDRAKLYVSSKEEIISFIKRMEQIEDFAYKIFDGKNGAENDEILCSRELASLLEDMLCR